MGIWYVYASYDYLDIAGLDCLVASYQLLPNGNAVNNEQGKNILTNKWVVFDSFYFDNESLF